MLKRSLELLRLAPNILLETFDGIIAFFGVSCGEDDGKTLKRRSRDDEFID